LRYEEPVYRPPSEANSLLIQCTIGCPHNRCTFCGMYKSKRFRIRQVEEILEDIRFARLFYGAEVVRTVFLPDGNTIIMRTEQLERVLRALYEAFPRLERVTSYGASRIIIRKGVEHFVRLHQAGLKRLHVGIESGDALTLQRIRKGATPEDHINAGRMVKEAGIELSEYVMVGIAGRQRSEIHAKESADVINAIQPDFVRIRTTVPVPNTPLWQAFRNGEFQLLTPYEALNELRLLIERITCSCRFLTDHVSNYIWLDGRLPDDKEKMIKGIDEALKLPREAFRPEIIFNL